MLLYCDVQNFDWGNFGIFEIKSSIFSFELLK